MGNSSRLWPAAAATHAARDVIGLAPSGQTTWPELVAFLEWARRYGFDGIDLSDSVVPFDQAACGDLSGLLSVARDHGLAFAGLNLLRCSLADETYGGENADRIRRAIDASARLETGIVSISLALPRAVDDANKYRGLDHARGSSRDASAADFERTADHLRTLAAEARSAGVALSIEVHHASLADNSSAVLRLLELAGDEGIGVNPDLVNGYWSYCVPEEGWQEQLRRLASRTNLWHVKNVQRVETDHGRRAEYLGTSLADGDVDYRWATRLMRDAGYRGWVSIERGGTGDALHTLRTSLIYLDELMQS